MGKPARKDLTLVKGDHESWTFSIDSPSGTDLDLTGYTEFVFAVSALPGSTKLFERKFSLGQVTVVDAATGKVRVDVTPTETTSLTIPKGRKFRRLWYSFRATTSSSANVTLAEGYLYLLQSAVEA